MSNILADETFYFDFKRSKKTIEMQLLEYQSILYDWVKISHAFALHLSSNTFKTMFLSGWK